MSAEPTPFPSGSILASAPGAGWFPLVFAVVATLLTLTARVSLNDVLGGDPTLVLFTIPIIVSAYLGGWTAGLTATLVAWVGTSLLLFSPLHSLAIAEPASRLDMAFLVVAGVSISAICDRLHRSRRHAEAVIGELRAKEEALRDALKTADELRTALDDHAIVAITDARGKITFVNDKFCAISRYTREELIGRDHRIINSGHHPKEFIRGLWETITSGRTWSGEIKNRAKDGSFYWVATTIVPFLDEVGKPRQYIAIRADITERKRIEEELRRALRAAGELRTALDDHAIVAITDARGKITFVNDKFCAISRYTREELIGRDHRIINSGHHPKEFICGLWETITSGRTWSGEIKNRAKDGSFYWVATTIVPFLDEDGKPRQYIAIRADITERKRIEEELRAGEERYRTLFEEIRELNGRLEQRVAERTAQLEVANRELEAFSYSVSHDLRAPLRTVDGFAQAVIEDYGPLLPEEGLRGLTTIREGAQQMGRLIDDLLTFSRLSRAPLNRTTINTGRLVQDTAQALDSMCAGRNVELRVADLPPCAGDPALLRQVWLNLLSNAFKYTGRREHAVVEVGSGRDASGATFFFVRDNGTGFDMRYVHKLFGVFQRLHRMEDYEGTGVGLAIVQRVVHRHGGRAWAEAEVNRGATFFFTLDETRDELPERH